MTQAQTENPSNQQTPKAEDNKLLTVVELVAVIGSVGGAVAGAITQNIALASLPISVTLALNFFNRQQLLSNIKQNHHLDIAHLQLEQQDNLNNLGNKLQPQIQNLENISNNSKEEIIKLQESTQNLQKTDSTTLKLVKTLQEIETWTSVIRLNRNVAEAYYNRGLVYERLGDKEGAIADFSEAICLDNNNPNTHHHRGLVRAALGYKQGAVEDFRAAAKLFFEQGDIDNYQKAKEMSQNVHQGQESTEKEADTAVNVENLFASFG